MKSGMDHCSLRMNLGFISSHIFVYLAGFVLLMLSAGNVSADDPSNTGGLPTDITVSEDIASNVDLSQITLADPDIGGSNLTLKLEAGAGTLSATSGSGVTASGSGTGFLTLVGTLANVDSYLNTASNIQYTTAANVSGNDVDTITVKANDGGASGVGDGTDVTLGTVNVDSIGTPNIISATYDASSGLGVVTGASIQINGGGFDIDASLFTFTGEGGATYTLTNTENVNRDSDSQFSLTLSATDKAALNQIMNKNGGTSTGSSTYNIAAADDWNTALTTGDSSDTSSNAVTVSSVPTPAIFSATYNAATAALVVTGTGLSQLTGAANDIDASMFTFIGEGSTTYTLTDTSDVEIASGTAFTITLSATDRAAVNQIINKDGASSTSGTTYNLAAGEDWARGADAAVNIADTAGNGITVSNVAVPTVTSATYDASAAALVVTGSGFSQFSGAANDIDASKLVFTGESGNTYTLTDTSDVEITSGTAFTITLSATDKAGVNAIMNKDGTTSTSGTTYNLGAAEDWARGANAAVSIADVSGNGITASNVPAPTITSASYDYNSNLLTVTGNGFTDFSGANNDIDVSKLTFSGEGGSTYTLTSASDVEISSGTQFSVTLSGVDLYNIEALLNKDGTVSDDSNTYNLVAAEDWARGADAAVNVVDASGNGITVSNWTAPTLISAAYNWSNAQLAITGANFVNASGAANDLDASMLSITGEGGSYTLTDSSDVEITSATTATLILSTTDQLNVHGLLNRTGVSSSSGTIYNLAAADNWIAGSPVSVNIADTAGNGITVTNVAIPTITSMTYDSDTGVVVFTGTNLFKKPGANNDIDLSMLTFTGGVGNATYTLTTASDVEITSATSFTFTLSGADKTQVDALLDQIGSTSSGGSTYNIAAADNWLPAANSATDISDTSNAITVSINPTISSATYNANTGVAIIAGSNIQANGGGSDIDASLFTFTGEDGTTYTLIDTADVNRDSSSQFTLTLSATDKTAVNALLNKAGSSSADATTYNLAAADNWDTNVTSGDTSDTTGNTITVANTAPTLTNLNGDNATFNIGGLAVKLDASSDATVADLSSPDFDGGNLTASITANAQSAEDVLSVATTSAISLSGSNVDHTDGVSIGSVTGGSAGNNLVITLNANATPERVQDLVRAIQYLDNDAGTTNTSARTVRITVTDGDGGSETSANEDINVNLVRAPIIDLDGDDSSGNNSGGYNAVFTQNGPAVSIADTDTTITDDGTFKSLTVTLTNRPNTTSESLSSSFGSGVQTVNAEAVAIGAYDSGTGILTITVYDTSTDATTMQMLMESMRYDNSSASPDNSNRVITFSATDNNDNPGPVATTTLTITSLDDLDNDGIPDSIDPDIDGDGIDNSYETTHGLDPRDNSDAALDNDNDGLTNLQEFNSGLDPNLDDNPPVVTPPADITINASGLFSAVTLGTGSATDALDGPLTPVSNGSSHYAPGMHNVTWSATDAAGNTDTAIQMVDVTPLVQFGKNRIIAEGSTVMLTVYLNGEAVSYPVTVPYTLSGTADATDYDLSTGTVSINSGNSASTTFNVLDDGAANEGDETLIVTVGTPNYAIAGAIDEQTFTIRDGNVAPEVSLSASQGGTQLTTISKNGGSVVITATVTDPNTGDSHQYDWADSDMALIDSDMVTTTFTLDPSTLDTGAYTVRIRVTDNASAPASGSAALSLRVIESAAILSSSNDQDGDGIDDASEGHGDDDNDGIPDYLDAINSPNVLQEQETVADSHLIETEPGIRITLGEIAIGSGLYQTQLDKAQIELEAGVAYSSGIYDFRITGLPVAGQSVNVVIPQANPVPANASYRKWSSMAGWNEFIGDNFNRLASSTGDEGSCPPPGDASYAEGLTEGHWCVQLTLEDGGPNDADRIANNNIDDPGGVTRGEPGSNLTGHSGGGLLGSGWLVMLLLLFTRPFGRKRRATILACLALLIPGISQADDWSVGFGLGRVDNSGYQSSVDSAVADSGIDVTTDTIDTSRRGYKLFAQYQTSEHLAWQLGYINLGDIGLDFTGAPADRDAFIDSDTTLPHGSAEGITTSVVAIYPASDSFSIYAKGGAFYWDASYTLSAGTERSFDDSGLDAYYGIGVSYVLSESVKLQLDREYFDIVGEDVHMTSLSIVILVD